MYSRNTEIRHIAAADAYQLAQILEHSNSWKKLMAIIPKTFSSPPVRDAPKKYNADEIRLIENASLKQGRTGAEILFDEWGTSGRKRPTVGNLLDLLVEAELLRAADYVAMNFLNGKLYGEDRAVIWSNKYGNLSKITIRFHLLFQAVPLWVNYINITLSHPLER